MKTLFKLLGALLLCSSALILSSCEDTVTISIPDEQQESLYSYNFTPEEAIEIAGNAAIELSGSQSRVMPRIANAGSVQIIGEHNSRTEGDDTLLYVVEYENNEGFALISGKRTTDPILAVINEGTYQEALDSENPAFREFLQKSKRYISIGDLPIDTLHKKQPTYREEITVLADENIMPKTANLKWGQEYPEGTYFSNHTAGCGPVALAIGMAYLKYPSSLSVTVNSTTKIITLNWDDIYMHTQSYTWRDYHSGDDCPSCNAHRHDAIALLCREIGRRAQADDSQTGQTGVERTNLGNAAISILGSAHIPNNFISYTGEGLRSACKSGIALLRAKDKISGKGHMWVADGYQYYSAHIRVYKTDPNGPISLDGPSEELVDEYYKTTFMVSCNWGWRGSCNGYYNWKLMNTKDDITKSEHSFSPEHILTIKK